MLSRLVRRTHMYLGLALFPWMLMYASSTLVMNHRALFVAQYGSGPVPFVPEREMTYDGVFPEAAPLKTISAQILASVGLDGSHGVSRRPDGTIVITRNDLVSPRRLTFDPGTRRLVIERMTFRSNAFLERFHRRRGFATGYGLDTVWAVAVDLAIAGMLFWALSGLWMWWEMKVTRALGAAALLGGAGLFAIFILSI
jgi:hypothetical protein